MLIGFNDWNIQWNIQLAFRARLWDGATDHAGDQETWLSGFHTVNFGVCVGPWCTYFVVYLVKLCSLALESADMASSMGLRVHELLF